MYYNMYIRRGGLRGGGGEFQNKPPQLRINPLKGGALSPEPNFGIGAIP